MADQQVGSSPVDYRLPNRQIQIPLNLRTAGATSYSTIRLSLQQKVGIFQAEGGQIMRQIDSTPLYADIVNATLHLGGSILAAYRSLDVDAVLQLECLPDWYGAEITLDSASATGVLTGKLKLSSADAAIAGNYPGRVRIVTTDTSGNDQKGLLWGFRARHYDGTATAALFYEAEQMTPVNGAAGTALSGASGGTAIQIGSPPASTWISMLTTTLAAGSASLSHQGTYRVWARAYSPAATPQFRLLWGPGGLAVPNTNDAAQLTAGTAVFQLLDLGQIRIDAPPIGSNTWQGAVQTYTVGTADSAYIDAIYFQPLDETAGKLAYTSLPASAASAAATALAGTAADDSATGTVTWINPTGVALGASAHVTFSAVSTTHYLDVTGFGFAIPSGTTIQGILVTTTVGSGNANRVSDARVRLIKGGVIQATDRAQAAFWPVSAIPRTYGGVTDLWGGSWTFSDINASNFGVAVSATCNVSLSTPASIFYPLQITVYYILASGFTVAQDAVVYAGGTAEIRTDGAYRAGTVTPYAPVSNVIGDLPRIPPSRLEARPVELFVKPTRGDLNTLADAGLDGFTAQVKYRPSFLFVGA
jgi:hypothetical protein